MNIKYRKATIEDSSFLLAMRNQESVRANSKNSAEIALDSHVSWFKQRLKDEEREGPILIFRLLIH